MKNILVVIDCQNDFISGSLANEEAKKKVPTIANKIRHFSGDAIFVTRDTHFKNYLETREGVNLPVEHCVKDTWGWQIEDNIQAALTDAKLRNVNVVYIDKPTFGSFDLVGAIDNLLHTVDEVTNEDIIEESNIEFMGFCTDICVVSNAMLVKAALYENANITVNANCCAGVTPDTHKAALTTMKMCQINVEE